MDIKVWYLVSPGRGGTDMRTGSVTGRLKVIVWERGASGELRGVKPGHSGGGAGSPSGIGSGGGSGAAVGSQAWAAGRGIKGRAILVTLISKGEEALFVINSIERVKS